MKKKLMYEVPDAELIELKLDSNQMQSSSYGGTIANATEEDYEEI